MQVTYMKRKQLITKKKQQCKHQENNLLYKKKTKKLIPMHDNQTKSGVCFKIT